MNIKLYKPSVHSRSLATSLLSGLGAFGLGAAGRWSMMNDAERAKSPEWMRKMMGKAEVKAPVQPVSATEATGQIGSVPPEVGVSPDFAADQVSTQAEEAGGGYDSSEFKNSWNQGEVSDPSMDGMGAETTPLEQQDIPTHVDLANPEGA